MKCKRHRNILALSPSAQSRQKFSFYQFQKPCLWNTDKDLPGSNYTIKKEKISLIKFVYRCLYLQTLNTTAREELSGKRTLSETNLELSSVVRLLEHRDYEPIGKKYYSHLKYKFTHIEAFTHIPPTQILC